jgi:hypothetical protein
MARFPSEEWTPCPKGELDRIAVPLATGGLRKALLTLVVAAAATASVAMASWTVSNAVRPMLRDGPVRECAPCNEVKPPTPVTPTAP